MSRLKLLLLAAFLGFASPALAASSNVNGLTASGAIVGTQLFYCPIGATTDLKCTAAQVAAYNYSLMNGDCTASGVGAITCTKTNGVSYGPLATAALTNTRAGDIVYWNGSAWAILPGNNVQNPGFLQETNLGVPSWVAGTASGVSSFSTTCPSAGPSTGAITLTNGANVLAEATAHTILTSECGAVFEVTGTTTITMPTIASGFEATVINQNAPGGAVVTVAADAGHTIGNNAASSITLTPGQSVGIAAGSGGTPTNWDLGPGTVSGFPITTGYVSGAWYTSAIGYAASTSGNQGAGNVFCVPYIVSNPGITVKALGVYATTTDAANFVSMALYSNGTNGKPNNLIDSIGTVGVAFPAANGVASASVANTTDWLTAGVYWTCAAYNSTTAILEGTITSGSGSSLIGTATLTAATFGVSSSGATALSCTAGSAGCGPTWAAGGGSSYTWPPSLASATFVSQFTSGKGPAVALQEN